MRVCASVDGPVHAVRSHRNRWMQSNNATCSPGKIQPRHWLRHSYVKWLTRWTLARLIFYPEDRGDIFIRNIGSCTDIMTQLL
jgi:hypothetical protein